MYYNHPVRNAGLGLALLFMTVLGFDNITYGYCLLQCVKESVLGGLVGLSAIVGMLGSISFPFLRKKLNVQKTGTIGMILLITTTAACVVSIWLPGSPFTYYNGKNETLLEIGNQGEDDCIVESKWSVGTLLLGIIMARYGLWVADLSITQIFQENVDEEVRGALGGVQGGLNSFMDTIKFVLVIIFPDPEDFGWLILASYCALVTGMISYCTYAIPNWSKNPTEPAQEIERENETNSTKSDSYQSFENRVSVENLNKI